MDVGEVEFGSDGGEVRGSPDGSGGEGGGEEQGEEGVGLVASEEAGGKACQLGRDPVPTQVPPREISIKVEARKRVDVRYTNAQTRRTARPTRVRPYPTSSPSPGA